MVGAALIVTVSSALTLSRDFVIHPERYDALAGKRH
jgi:hypothetical protein